jgi:glycosyltransferase involved in cell wall biosynthesis
MITVLLATHNGANTIDRTLAAMSALDAPAGGWKLVVINNASTDDTQSRVLKWRERLPLEYLVEPRLGKSKAVNTGLRRAEGDFIVMTDDDVLPDRNWLTEWRRVADAFPQCAVFGGAISPEFGDHPPPSYIPESWYGVLYGASPRYAEGEIHPMPGTNLFDIAGANLAIRKSVYDRGSRFDENFLVGENGLMGEDTEFVRQQSALGYRVGFTPHARLRHIIHAHQTHWRWIHYRFFRHGRAAFMMKIIQAGEWEAACFPWHLLPNIAGSSLRYLVERCRNDRQSAFVQSQALAYDMGAIRQALASLRPTS